MKRTHFASVDRANESDNNDYWSDTACGLEYTESPLSDDWEEVTCKHCLKRKKGHEYETKQAMEQNIRDMDGFVKHQLSLNP